MHVQYVQCISREGYYFGVTHGSISCCIHTCTFLLFLALPFLHPSTFFLVNVHFFLITEIYSTRNFTGANIGREERIPRKVGWQRTSNLGASKYH